MDGIREMVGGVAHARTVALRIVACTGMRRSASTWSYNVCRELLAREAAATGARFTFDYCLHTDKAIASVLEEYAASPSGRILLLKAHQPGPNTRQWIGQGKIANVFTLRDPRDALASMVKFFPEKSDIDHRIWNSKHDLRLAEEFATGKCSLMLRYERVTADPQAGIRRIADFLRCEVTPEVVEEIDRATGVEAARKIADAVAAAQAKRGPRARDPFTHIHAHHIQGGTIGRWRDELPLDVQRRLDEELGRWLEMFGYDRLAQGSAAPEMPVRPGAAPPP